MQIMLLEPIGKDYLWGGTKLKYNYNKNIDILPLAETWECSVHPDGPSKVVNGKYKGKTLDRVLKEHPEYLGTKMVDGAFPILVKFIDAAEDLSIQVHPNDEDAKIYENQKGKTEMWYVLEAEPRASLICGFIQDVTAQQLKQAIQTGQLVQYLHRIPVHKGDVFYIPAGTIHAIGGGALIAEIQQNSNVTYRVYDYDRTDKNGNKRVVHVDKALRVLNMRAESDRRKKARLVHYYPGYFREVLCRCKYFETERILVRLDFSFSVTEESFQIILCLDGSGSIQIDTMKEAIKFRKGNCLFIPAKIGNCYIWGNTELLKIRC